LYNKDAILEKFSATASDHGCQKLQFESFVVRSWRIAKIMECWDMAMARS